MMLKKIFIIVMFILSLTFSGCSNVFTPKNNHVTENKRPSLTDIQLTSSNEPDIFTLQLGASAQGTPDYHDTGSTAVLVNKENHLPSDYVPFDLMAVTIPFLTGANSEQKLLRREAAENLEALFEEAQKNDAGFYGISGYRSYQTQDSIFAWNVRKYGDEQEANRISAKPGESEHQTGLAMDISVETVNYRLVTSFEDTKEYSWLQKNAHLYGFVVRYPKDKEIITGYIYEPWHLRYIGKELAAILYENNLTYEEYLFFDQPDQKI